MITAGLVIALGGVVASAVPAQAATFDEYFALSTTGLNFGDDIAFGSPNITQSYTITALQDATLSTGGWYTPGVDQWIGEVASGACAGMNVFNTSRFMPAGSVCTITVTFNPNVSLAPINSVQGSRTWTASAGGVSADANYIPYTGLVWSLSIDPRSLSFTAAPGIDSAPQTVTLTNKATVPLSAMTLGGLSSPPFTANLGACATEIPVGATCDISFVYRGGALGDSVANQLTLNYSATGPNGLKSYTYQSTMIQIYGYTYVAPPTADIGVTKTLVSSGPFTVGTLVEWQLEVSNLGPDTDNSVRFYDFPGFGLNYDHSTGPGCDSEPPLPMSQPGVTVRAGWGQCELGQITAGQTVTFSVFTRISDDVDPGTTLSNYASVYGSGIDPDYNNNSANADVGPTEPLASLRITKVAESAETALDAPFTWTITASNHGPNSALATTIVDDVPAGLTIGALPSACVAAANQVSCSAGDLAAGDSAEFVIPTTVTDSALAGLSVTNTATVSTDSVDATPGNNTAQATVAIAAIVPTPTPTPTPTSAPTPSPTPTASPSPSPSPSPSTTDASSGLARTGFDGGIVALLGIGILVLGMSMIQAARIRVLRDRQKRR